MKRILTGLRLSGDARSDNLGDPSNLTIDYRNLAGVQTGPDLDADIRYRAH